MAASIRGVGPRRYTLDQVEAWASAAHDDVRFPRLVQDAFTLLAEDGPLLLGFGAVTPTGHLTALYVHPRHGRRGLGSRLLTGLLEHAKQQGIWNVHTEASEFSRSLFAKAGFRLDAVETVEPHGVTLHRHRMSLSLP